MTGRWISILLLAGTFSCVLAEQQIFQQQRSGSGVLRRFSGSSTQVVLAAAQEHDLDIWHATDSFVDIYFPSETRIVPHELAQIPHTSTSISTPVRRSALPQSEWIISSLANTTYHQSYHPLSEVQSFIKQLANAHPDITHLVNLGETAEGRELHGLTISTSLYHGDERDQEYKGYKKKKSKNKAPKKTPRPHDEQKLGFVIIGAQHAREWVATAAASYIIQSIVANSSEPYSLGRLLDHFDFHVIPVPNPDGYEYTWNTDRYWYKNRQTIGPYTDCVGLDMNRNWGYKWKPVATDGGYFQPRNAQTTKPRQPINPCSHWYPGTRPFESPEVNNIANWISILPNVVAFVDLRSYGQMISSPYSYTCTRTPKDAEDQIEAALGASHAMKSVYGKEFQVGPLCSMLYPAYGNIVDWMYTKEAIKYSYVAHLRDTGTYGFSLPEKWIRPAGEEGASMIEYIARFIARQAKRRF